MAAAADIRKKVEEYPIYLKNVVAPDGRAAAINIFFAEMTNDEFMRRGIDEAVQAIVDRENAAALTRIDRSGCIIPAFPTSKCIPPRR